MVRITSLEKLYRFALENDLKRMKEWQLRKFPYNVLRRRNRYQENLRKKVRFILDLFSGGNISEMLKCVLKNKELNELVSERKEIQALRNMAECYNNTNRKKRFHFVRRLRRSRLTYSAARRLGFTVSERLWKTCYDGNARNKGGGQAISKEMRDSIRSFLNENSNIGANRLVINRDKNDKRYKQKIPVRYLEKNQTELYNEFPHADKISKDTFIKYMKMSNEFKKPFRWTDLCDYCEKGKKIKSDLVRALTDLKYEWQTNFDLEHIRKFLIDKRNEFGGKCAAAAAESGDNRQELDLYNELKNVNTTIENVDCYDAIEFHKNVARCQRIAYNNHRKNVDVLRGKIMIEVDFKQKIVIGMGGPRQVNSEYYEQQQRSCLGFGVYHVVDNEIKLINFDIISSNLSTDASAAVRGFRFLRDQDFFKEIDKLDYIVWMDCGTHFRNGMVIGYLLCDLAKEGIRVNVNFFGDKHGKNSRDAHFSHVSRFVETASLIKRLTSSNDIVVAINEGQERANKNSSRRIVTHAAVLDRELEEKYNSKCSILTIQHIASYYNYRSVDGDRVDDLFPLKTSILSNQELLLDLTLGKKQIKKGVMNEYQVVDEVVIREEDMSGKLGTLIIKKARINSAMLKIKNDHENDEIETPVMNYFILKDKDGEVVQEDAVMPPAQIQPQSLAIAAANDELTPIYCRLRRQGKKPACSECTSPCTFKLEMITNSNRAISQGDLIEELRLHHHPTSRKIEIGETIHQRTTKEAAEELAQHYILYHNKK